MIDGKAPLIEGGDPELTIFFDFLYLFTSPLIHLKDHPFGLRMPRRNKLAVFGMDRNKLKKKHLGDPKR